MILAHAAGNVLNDFFDFRHGVDVPGSPTTRYRRHPLVEGDFTPGFIFGLSLICYVVAAAIGLYFFLTHGWSIVLFAILGGIGGICYTAGPVNYKYRAMGEMVFFFLWGPLMMTACYFIQTKSWEYLVPVLLVSIPQGLWVSLVLFANNLTDTDHDSETGVRTLGTLLGRDKGIRFFIAVVIIIYIITGIEILAGVISLWGFLTLLSFPMILILILRFQREKTIPSDADPQVARAGMIYGVLLIASFLLSTVF
jgi:1,4-dihydroxy-2-naphthoate octaprenyltransferase